MKLNQAVDQNTEAENILKEINGDKFRTAMNKAKFINSIRNEFGEELKKNPRKVTIIKQSIFTRISLFFKKLLASI